MAARDPDGEGLLPHLEEDIQEHRSAESRIRYWARFLVSRLPGAPSLANVHPTPRKQQRILIFRLGSLGDTVVALPSFHLIAEAFPSAYRAVLTNFPEHRKAPPLSAVLGDSGLVQEYLEYPPHASLIMKLRHTRRQLRELQPDIVIYLMPVRTRWQIFRDRVFFNLCGIRHIIGLPETKRQRTGLMNPCTGLWTHESERLLSTLSHLGQIDLCDATAWEFHFTAEERRKAYSAMHALPSDKPILALSLGAKNPVNEWGHGKWMELLTQLPSLLPDWSLILVGAQEDYEPSQKLARCWPFPAQNLCGALSPRESAIVLQTAAIFLGQDSGPMHLAAAMRTPCVAVFSSRNPPGEWFPYGKNHEVIHHPVPCGGCRLTACTTQKKRCINEIQPLEVKGAVERVLSKLNGKPECNQ